MSNRVLVIDNGSGTIKAGFAGDDTPACVFPAVVGNPRFYDATGSRPTKIGASALRSRGVLAIKVW